MSGRLFATLSDPGAWVRLMHLAMYKASRWEVHDRKQEEISWDVHETHSWKLSAVQSEPGSCKNEAECMLTNQCLKNVQSTLCSRQHRRFNQPKEVKYQPGRGRISLDRRACGLMRRTKSLSGENFRM